MIYGKPSDDAPIDQGDILDGCPQLSFIKWDLDEPSEASIKQVQARVIVLTQACDLANEKTNRILVASVLDPQQLIDDGVFKPADIKGPVRALRVWGWYFLPKSDEFGLPESLVDLRQLHTVRPDLLAELVRRGKRQARLQPLYREHLNQHFANSYARIGLPQPYPTD